MALKQPLVLYRTREGVWELTLECGHKFIYQGPELPEAEICMECERISRIGA